MFGAHRVAVPSDTPQSLSDEVADALYKSSSGMPWDVIAFERAGILRCIALASVASRADFPDGWSITAMEEQEDEFSLPGVNWVVPEPGTPGGAIVQVKKTIASWRDALDSSLVSNDETMMSVKESVTKSETVTPSDAKGWLSSRREFLRSATPMQYNAGERTNQDSGSQEGDPREDSADVHSSGYGIGSILSALGRGATVVEEGGD